MKKKGTHVSHQVCTVNKKVHTVLTDAFEDKERMEKKRTHASHFVNKTVTDGSWGKIKDEEKELM